MQLTVATVKTVVFSFHSTGKANRVSETDCLSEQDLYFFHKPFLRTGNKSNSERKQLGPLVDTYKSHFVALRCMHDSYMNCSNSNEPSSGRGKHTMESNVFSLDFFINVSHLVLFVFADASSLLSPSDC